MVFAGITSPVSQIGVHRKPALRQTAVLRMLLLLQTVIAMAILATPFVYAGPIGGSGYAYFYGTGYDSAFRYTPDLVEKTFTFDAGHGGGFGRYFDTYSGGLTPEGAYFTTLLQASVLAGVEAGRIGLIATAEAFNDLTRISYNPYSLTSTRGIVSWEDSAGLV